MFGNITRCYPPLLRIADPPRIVDVIELGVAHIHCVIHPVQARFGQAEIGELRIHDGVLGFDGKTASIHTFSPLSIAVIGGFHHVVLSCVLANEVEEVPVIGMVITPAEHPLPPELICLFCRQANVYQSLERDQVIGKVIYASIVALLTNGELMENQSFTEGRR